MNNMNKWSLILDIIKTFTALVAAGAAWYYFKKKAHADTILKYAERYDKVMDSFPEKAFLRRFSPEEELPDCCQKLTLAVLKYLNLCSEEYHLYKEGYIAKKTWDIWERELKKVVRSALFGREWEVLKDEFESDSDFKRLVDETRLET
jgi:hypothetical protein